MRKRLISISFIFILIITISTVLVYFNKTKQTTAFPHYKQAMLKFSGSIYTIVNFPFHMSLVFADEQKLSEMASAENIKEIKLIDKSGNEFKFEKWEIINGLEGKGFIMRNLKGELTFNKNGIHDMGYVDIQFKDGKTKKYDMGDLKVVVLPKEPPDKSPQTISIQIIPAKNFTYATFSGFQLIFYTGDFDTTIDSIDIGVKGFGIDRKDVIVKDNIEDVNYFYNASNNKEKWVKVFDSIKVSNGDNEKFKPIHFKKNNKMPHPATILLPLTIDKNIDVKDKILVFSPTMDVTINDGDSFYKKGKYKVYTIEGPWIDVPFDIDPIKLIKESGI